ncbi:MAG: hypothetical protein C0397_19485 [Odoribacter sp.]|nr:hypothetical protein [Odoribacter sp.]
MNFGVKERVSAFDKQHGSFVRLEDYLLFEDGAMREVNPMGLLASPPKDNYQRTRLICKYYQRRLDLAVEEFDERKQHFTHHAKVGLRQKNCPPPIAETQEAVTQLKALRAKVKLCQKNLEQAKVAMDACCPNRMAKDEIETTNRQSNEDFLNAIEAIEI